MDKRIGIEKEINIGEKILKLWLKLVLEKIGKKGFWKKISEVRKEIEERFEMIINIERDVLGIDEN